MILILHILSLCLEIIFQISAPGQLLLTYQPSLRCYFLYEAHTYHPKSG